MHGMARTHTLNAQLAVPLYGQDVIVALGRKNFHTAFRWSAEICGSTEEALYRGERHVVSRFESCLVKECIVAAIRDHTPCDLHSHPSRRGQYVDPLVRVLRVDIDRLVFFKPLI